ncbi:phage tail sheath family protein [Lysinibacillus sp. OL1_EC]|uniref:phage tail sheath family protein n=1 Tax=unclassified Lysinibacillus TaxID=2636778 RepID=UPI00103B92DF|nr:MULTISPECIES: phage tail sheath family protein [unclassified Lysinibacillus]MCM0627039.1 phage tail sheath family protein [Lysinibacillus sp. OL1_EC]TBV85140.1 phage tail sheath family protein [Lysinibacillus sp. OL1]
MAYKHGVYGYELPTSIVPPLVSTAGLTVVFGTAPIHLLNEPEKAVNRAELAYTYSEAVKKMGYSADFDKYTICEAISSHFALFAIAPLVMINVLDPEKHAVAGSETVKITKGEGVFEADGVLKATVVVKNGSNPIDKKDYELEFDDEGKLHIYTSNDGEVNVEFERLDPSLVAAADIVGGVSLDGSYKGIELVNTVFPRFREVPGILIAPKFSTNPLVAAVLKAKSKNINGLFQAKAFVDVPTTEVRDYTAVPEYKNMNNLDDPNMEVFWPKCSLDGIQYHKSTQAASLFNLIDAQNEGYPYHEASNNNLQMDAAVLEDGTEILLGLEQANYLNGQGIVTSLNFIGGWKLWGHRTSCYPGNTDPKDTFISVRRVFIYEMNQFILSYWQKVDKPGNRKLIDNVVDSKNIDLNGKAARQFILGGRIEFLREENPLTELIDGTYAFHLFLTPATPGRQLKALFEFDPTYFETLFA